MPLILDSDAVIKLNRGAILELVARSFDCVIPEAVYWETVTRARERGYQDAEHIDRIVRAFMRIEAVVVRDSFAGVRGAGEREVLALGMQISGDSVIVSDDAQFTNRVDAIGIQHLSPIALVPIIARDGVITVDEARSVLQRMRTLTREDVYRRASQDLDALAR